MSFYQLHRCVYDWVRAGEVNSASSDGRLDFDDSQYELTDEERTALAKRVIQLVKESKSIGKIIGKKKAGKAAKTAKKAKRSAKKKK